MRSLTVLLCGEFHAYGLRHPITLAEQHLCDVHPDADRQVPSFRYTLRQVSSCRRAPATVFGKRLQPGHAHATILRMVNILIVRNPRLLTIIDEARGHPVKVLRVGDLPGAAGAVRAKGMGGERVIGILSEFL